MKSIKIEIKWAFLFVLMSLLWMFLERIMGWHGEHLDKHALYTNLFAIPAIALYVFALLDKRKNAYDGIMTYKQGFISGIILTVIIAILSPLTQYLTTTVITPEYFPNMIEYSVANELLTQEVAEETFTLGNYMVQGVVGALVMGLFTTAIVAIFTKKKPAPAVNINQVRNS